MQRAARSQIFGMNEGDAVYRFDKAEVVVTLASDITGGGHEGLYEAVGLGANRRLRESGNAAKKGHLIAFEPTLSQTGSVADVRQRVGFDELDLVAEALAWRVAVLLGKKTVVPSEFEASYQQVTTATDRYAAHPALAGAAEQGAVDYAAARLVEHQGAGIVYVGGATHTDPASAHLYKVAALINAVLGNEGSTVEPGTWLTAEPASLAATREVLAAAAAGQLKTLVISEANPVYSLPGAKAQIEQAKAAGVTVVAIADRLDETAALADAVAPASHAAECWGDGEVRPGFFALQQAVVTRLWDSRAAAQSLISFAAAAGIAAFAVESAAVAATKAVVSRTELYDPRAVGVLSWAGLVKQVWQQQVRVNSGSAASAEAFWTAVRGRGFVEVPVMRTAVVRQPKLSALGGKPAPRAGGTRLVLSA
ncbi:MAG: molybdopterin-binding domain-containing protein, partial [Planctomycetota bacterium]